MGLLDKLRRKKETQTEIVKKEVIITDFEKFSADDKESYEALQNTMFLDPRKLNTLLPDAIKKAKEFEKKGDTLKAKIWYEIAGGLAIYEGDVKKVVEFFGESEKISPGTKYLILKNPERAVAKAREYYEKHLKA